MGNGSPTFTHSEISALLTLKPENEDSGSPHTTYKDKPDASCLPQIILVGTCYQEEGKGDGGGRDRRTGRERTIAVPSPQDSEAMACLLPVSFPQALAHMELFSKP